MKDKSSYLFNVVNVNTRKSIMITGSPSKAETLLQKGIRIEVFKNNFYLETIYAHRNKNIKKYLKREKEYHRFKQKSKENKKKKR